MSEYNFKSLEKYWKEKWESEKLYQALYDTTKKKFYVLDMFPYPSGDGLHVGHARIYTASDIYTRTKRMQGFNVLHPTGWDAFGLPAEETAIKNKVHPRVLTDKNINTFRSQMKNLGISYDFSREVDTTDPEFYKWTQWIFLKMYEKGLAFQSYEPINWCPSCQTGLANEDLEGGKCERCGSVVEQKPMRQWVLRITDYADKLLNDLDTLNEWPEWLKTLQRNWIGKSEGAEFDFKVEGGESFGVEKLKIFTTRADTLFGATYTAISAELAESWIKNGWIASGEIKNYISKTIAEQKEANDYSKEIEKTGIETGIFAINPANGEKIPVWIANYILGGVGTGAIMAVPAHDERDFDFAKKYNLENRETPLLKSTDEMIKEFGGKKTTRYKLQDWVFSRQRYWGEPIPIVHDTNGKDYSLDESELPLTLPEVENYTPSGTGESPLANISQWVNVKGHITPEGKFKQSSDGEIFKRETNTMPQWAGSSWYYLRFADQKNKNELISKDLEKYWNPVDVYVGGAEHATRHLIYARFYHKFLFDIGVVSHPEPFTRMESVGLVLGEDGTKMSKRLGNSINPDAVIAEWGVDVMRIYIAFMGSFYDATPWNPKAIIGCKRFLDKVLKCVDYIQDEEVKEIVIPLNQTIKKVTEDFETFKFNTAVSQMMIFINKVEEAKKISKDQMKDFVKLLAPIAVVASEEIWKNLDDEKSVHIAEWPKYDEKFITENEVVIAIQVNGKLRGTVNAPYGISQNEIIELVKKTKEYEKNIGNIEPKKIIFIPNKLVNIVI